jgi:hypothetical protein
LLTAVAEAIRRQEVCALVDAGDSLHPESAAAAGMDLQRLLWIRCGQNLSQSHGINDFRMEHCRLKNQYQKSSPPMNADKYGSGPIRQSSIFNHQFAQNSEFETRNFAGNWQLTADGCVANRQSRDWDSRLTQVLKTTDLLLQSGGFGMVVVDLADVPPRFARRIPLASWFRFRCAVENTPTVLLVIEQEPYAKTCASLVLRMQRTANGQPPAIRSHLAFSTQHSASGALSQRPTEFGSALAQQSIFSCDLPSHAQLLRGLPVEAEIVHARFQRKPARSAARFETRAAWANSLAG